MDERPVAPQITLVTPSLPERAHLLAELLDCVAKQTVRPQAHIILVDDDKYVPKMRKLVSMVKTEYYVEVDDDDLIYPDHVETLSNNLRGDLVWTWCDVSGAPWSYNSPYRPGVLQQLNYIPSNCAVRVKALEAVGGWLDVERPDHPDWNILRRFENRRFVFHNVPKVTWQYRFGVSRQLSQT